SCNSYYVDTRHSKKSTLFPYTTLFRSITEHLRNVCQLHAWSGVGASGEDANALRRNDVLGHCVEGALIELSAHALEELDVLVDRGRQHAGSTIVEVEAT